MEKKEMTISVTVLSHAEFAEDDGLGARYIGVDEEYVTGSCDGKKYHLFYEMDYNNLIAVPAAYTADEAYEWAHREFSWLPSGDESEAYRMMMDELDEADEDAEFTEDQLWHMYYDCLEAHRRMQAAEQKADAEDAFIAKKFCNVR